MGGAWHAIFILQESTEEMSNLFQMCPGNNTRVMVQADRSISLETFLMVYVVWLLVR